MTETKRHLRDFALEVGKTYKEWLDKHYKDEDVQKLNKHEVIKSICVLVGGGIPEFKKEYRSYNSVRQGRVDYVDNDFAVEIDDAKNINAFRKLIAMEEEDGRKPLWIIHCNKNYQKLLKEAKTYAISVLLIRESGRYSFVGGGSTKNRSTKRIKYKVPPKKRAKTSGYKTV